MAGNAVTELTVVNRLKDLSKDVANQPYIARRGILPTLKKFLGSPNDEVQIAAAQTLGLLASHPDNPEYIAKESGMVNAVLKAYDKTTNAELKAELEKVMACLQSVSPATTTSTSPDDAPPKKGATKAYPAVPEQHRRSLAPRHANLQGKSKTVRRHMVLRSEAITPENVDGLEHLLQYIRGMISYSIDTQNKTLNLFLTTPKHILMKHLLDCGFESEIVQETQAKAPCAKGDAPSYLTSEGPSESDYKKSLVIAGEAQGDDGSLAARLKERHKARNKASEEERSSITGFFSGLARNLLTP